MSGIGKLLKGVAAVFVKKVTTLESDGEGGTEEVTRTRPREGVKGIGWITGFLLVWHFLMQPVLSYHFPHYHFPALDFGWLGSLFMGL